MYSNKKTKQMKMSKQTLIPFLMVLGLSTSNAQSDNQPYEMAPSSSEKVIGTVSGETDAGRKYDLYVYKESMFSGGWEYDDTKDKRSTYSKGKLYEYCLSEAKRKYGNSYPDLALRNFTYCKEERSVPNYTTNSQVIGSGTKYSHRDVTERVYIYSATVVIGDPKVIANQKLSNAIDKSFRNIRQESRIAIDQVIVPSTVNRDDYKDKLIDILLDKGYKIVAKEFLQKLYEEQQAQQSGIYNDRTTVQENNFSAVGYYVNVKLTETSIRIQVINVSTGEYESNATIEL